MVLGRERREVRLVLESEVVGSREAISGKMRTCTCTRLNAAMGVALLASVRGRARREASALGKWKCSEMVGVRHACVRSHNSTFCHKLRVPAKQEGKASNALTSLFGRWTHSLSSRPSTRNRILHSQHRLEEHQIPRCHRQPLLPFPSSPESRNISSSAPSTRSGCLSPYSS